MSFNGWVQILLFMLVILALTRPMGRYLAWVYEGERTLLTPVIRPIEMLIYRLCGVDRKHEMRWTEYAVAMLAFSLVSLLVLYLLQRTQSYLPLNPQKLSNPSPHLAFNTAASFTTNSNWQSYAGETTMSYLTQMAGLAYQNFVSASVGIAVAIAFIRGIARKETDRLGNFWVDLVRGTLYVLLPVTFPVAMFFVSQGVVQNFKPYDTVRLIDPQRIEKTNDEGRRITETVSRQVIAQGPAASQLAIKMLGTNGGGFFNANSAHPFENPTPLTNFVEMVLIFLIPAGLTWTLGSMTGSPRHGWAVFAGMAILFIAGVTVAYRAESQVNPLYPANVSRQAGGNMEGKEVRFGIANSALFATITTGASCGAVNSMHDSFMPLGGLVPLVNIQLGEIIFGGVGAGMYGMLIFVILSIFIAGLMVGRTPEYLGKKIESFDIKMAMLYVLIFPLILLGFTAISVLSPDFGLSSLNNNGPHGLSEILYAYSSGTGNNGSAFAGLNANTLWYNATLGMSMLAGRFLMIIPALAIAGNLAGKKRVPPGLGTFPVTTPLFTILLVSVVLIVGALTFFPVLSLGPIVEHLLMNAGQVF